jgi:hypothetical protein
MKRDSYHMKRIKSRAGDYVATLNSKRFRRYDEVEGEMQDEESIDLCELRIEPLYLADRS